MQIKIDTCGNDKQKQCVKIWADKTTTEIVYGGSKGSGKSFIGCSLIIGSALMYPNSRWFIARKKLNDLRKHTIPSINEVLNIWGISDAYYKFNAQDNVFKFHNKSEVLFIDAAFSPSDPKYSRFGSMQNTGGWIEEAGDFEAEAKQNLSATCGRWMNKEYNLPPKLLMTCNPSKNFLYTEFYKPFKNGVLADNRAFIQALPQDNKKLPEGYLPHLHATLDVNAKQRLLYGNWEYDDDPRALISIDACNDYFTNIHVQKTGKKYITADIARKGKDNTVIRVWDGFVVIERKCISKSLVNESVNAINELAIKHEVPRSRIAVDEDGIGGGVVDYLPNCFGFVNNSKALNGENYKNLKSQCGYLMAKKISDREVYEQVDSSDLKNRIIEEFEQVKLADIDVDGKVALISKDVVKEYIGRSPDEWDSIMMRGIFELEKQQMIIHW